MNDNSNNAKFDLPVDKGSKVKQNYVNRVVKTYPITEPELRSIKSFNSMSSILFGTGTFILGNYICNQDIVSGVAYIATGICFILSGICYWHRYKILSDIEQSVDNFNE